MRSERDKDVENGSQREEWSCYLSRRGIWRSLVVFLKITCIRTVNREER